MSVQKVGPVAFLSQSHSAVFFSKSTATFPTASGNGHGTALPIRKLQNELNVAFWGEDNRFPQNIEQQMAYCGIGKAGLEWKAKMLYGNGIVPGRVTGQKDDGSDIFEPLKRSGADKSIYAAIEQRSIFRFFMEYLLDWTWYSNCFPEVIFSKDCKTITGFVHQESCDARYKQMDEDGWMKTVYLSKLWGASSDQFARFDPTKAIRGLLQNPTSVDQIDKRFLKTLPAIDMYNPLATAKEIADNLRSTKGMKSAILPVNYPSPNKTYYQVPAWDGARLSGWVEIAAKIPVILKSLYENAFRIRYHIEIPENYFVRKFGVDTWTNFKEEEKSQKEKELLESMDNYLSGAENAHKSFISFFETNAHDKTEYNRIKITQIKDESNLDKEILSNSAAENQILISMGIQPTLFGAGTIGSGQQRSGGSDKREAFLLYLASLSLERQVVLEPLYLMRDFNGWDSDIQFRFKDIILTTLDTGAGTKKTLS